MRILFYIALVIFACSPICWQGENSKEPNENTTNEVIDKEVVNPVVEKKEDINKEAVKPIVEKKEDVKKEVVIDKESADNTSINIDLTLDRAERVEKIYRRIEMIGAVEQVKPTGLHMVIGNAVMWCINNAVKADGWQLTGWSKVTLDKNFKPSRLKIGIISPEINASTCLGQDPDKAQWDEYERWRQQHQGVTFGVFWTREF